MGRALTARIAFYIILRSSFPAGLTLAPQRNRQKPGGQRDIDRTSCEGSLQFYKLLLAELSPVAIALRRKDTALAERELAQYFRVRQQRGLGNRSCGCSPSLDRESSGC